MIRLVSWNMARRREAWFGLTEPGRRPRAGAGSCQTAVRITACWQDRLRRKLGDILLGGRGPWRTAIVPLTDRTELHPRTTLTLETATSAEDWVVSRAGSIAAADVISNEAPPFTAVSVYAAWETAAGRGFADGSAHRILSDLSALTTRRGRPLIVAGDWNILRGYGEFGDAYWQGRYDTVFDRAEALGLRFVGPQFPNARQILGRTNYPPGAAACPPSTTRGRNRRPPLDSSTLCLSRQPLPTV